MSGPRIGSLCSGYGGLDMGVHAVLGGSVAWVSDIDKGACKILAHRHPDVPNLGDFTRTDWSTVEPIDILTAGFPCQPVSHAGKRLGADDERWLWDDVARAVSELRPGLVVLENVRGLLSAGGGRLFGRVLGTLAALGYDAQWHGLRAADVGAPHGRWRVFIVATDTQGRRRREGWSESARVVRGSDAPERGDDDVDDGPCPHGWPFEFCGLCHNEESGDWGSRLLPTPTSRDFKGHNQRHDSTCLTGALLPTPSVADGMGGHLNRSGARSNELLLPGVAKHLALLPTPMVGSTNPAAHGQISGDYRAKMNEALANWGQYADAIARWESLTRPAPPPTETGPKGNPRLSARFSEWMMGLPDGWITDVPSITRNEALKSAGNGVVPQQAEAAVRFLLGVMGGTSEPTPRTVDVALLPTPRGRDKGTPGDYSSEDHRPTLAQALGIARRPA